MANSEQCGWYILYLSGVESHVGGSHDAAKTCDMENQDIPTPFSIRVDTKSILVLSMFAFLS